MSSFLFPFLPSSLLPLPSLFPSFLFTKRPTQERKISFVVVVDNRWRCPPGTEVPHIEIDNVRHHAAAEVSGKPCRPRNHQASIARLPVQPQRTCYRIVYASSLSRLPLLNRRCCNIHGEMNGNRPPSELVKQQLREEGGGTSAGVVHAASQFTRHIISRGVEAGVTKARNASWQ